MRLAPHPFDSRPVSWVEPLDFVEESGIPTEVFIARREGSDALSPGGVLVDVDTCEAPAVIDEGAYELAEADGGVGERATPQSAVDLPLEGAQGDGDLEKPPQRDGEASDVGRGVVAVGEDHDIGLEGFGIGIHELPEVWAADLLFAFEQEPDVDGGAAHALPRSKRGQLAEPPSEVIGRASAMLEEETMHLIDIFMNLLEPIVLAGVSLIVGSILIAVLMPMSNLISAL